MKTVFVFSGQGAQYPMMGKELFSHHKAYQRVFDEADEILGYGISRLCFTESDILNDTRYTQPAVFTMSMAIFQLLKSMGIHGDCMAGFSLGEYSALCAGGAYSFQDLLPVVRSRGLFMAEAVPPGSGAMAAVMGCASKTVEQVCGQVTKSGKGLVAAANYNMPGQIVIAGELDAVAAAEKQLKAAGAKKTVRLKVSGPFHTALMAPAAEKLYGALKKIKLREPGQPLITNVTGDFIEDYKDIPALLKKQVMSPVLWEQGVRRAIEAGAERFVELGPGKTLSAFIKKINRDVAVYNIEDLKTLEKTVQAIGSLKEGYKHA